jgi:peptidoglycan L-alanyl-D-glutamate endopeptidase CwlK
MSDSITVKRIYLLHPNLRDEALSIYKDICEALDGRAEVRFTHTLRTFDEQNKLYSIGRTIAGRKVTNAKGGQSYHNYGLAIDIVLIIDGKEISYDTKKDYDGDGVSDWMEIVKIFTMYGWEWGGNWQFKDTPHFQKTFGYSIKQLQKMGMKSNYPLI